MEKAVESFIKQLREEHGQAMLLKRQAVSETLKN